MSDPLVDAAAADAARAARAAHRAQRAAGDIPLPASPPPGAAQDFGFAGNIRLTDYYADSPQSWFRQINSQFASCRITRPLTKFHYAVSKLPASLMDTVGALCDHPTAVADPYAELQAILVRSYGLSAAQKTARLLDHPGLGPNKPSVLMDQLIALKPDSLDDVVQVLFFRKMPSYIRDVVNPKDYKSLYDLTQRCNEIYEHRSLDAGQAAAVVAAATHRPQSPGRNHHRASSPARGKQSGTARRRSPTPSPTKGRQDGGQNGDKFCFYHARFGSRATKCRPPCSYQENE